MFPRGWLFTQEVKQVHVLSGDLQASTKAQTFKAFYDDLCHERMGCGC